jgi:hypothetical protein
VLPATFGLVTVAALSSTLASVDASADSHASCAANHVECTTPLSAEDGADTFNVAPGTSVGLSSTQVVISVPSSSPAMVITCTTSSLSGKTKSSLTFPTGIPVFSDAGSSCSDNLGFTDSFAANATHGSWSVHEKDFTNASQGDEGLPEPNATGDKFVIHMPTAGLVDTNNWPCSLTFAPAASASISGTYNDAGTFAIKNAKIPVSVSGPPFCGPASQTVTLTATYTLSKSLFDQG